MAEELRLWSKVASDYVDYYVDWRPWLANDPEHEGDNDGIVSSLWTADPSTDLLLHSPSFSSGLTKVYIGRGILGCTYTITNTIHTVLGDVESRAFQLIIVARRGAMA